MHDRLCLGVTAIAVAAVTAGCSQQAAAPGDNGRNSTTADIEAAHDIPQQAGIGAALRIEDGKVLVAKVLPDTPSARSNVVNVNDQIVAVAEGDGDSVDITRTTDVAKVVGMIRGPVGTVVRLTIIPHGKVDADRVVVSMVRGTVKEIDQFVDGRLLPVGAPAPNFQFVHVDDARQSELSQLTGRVVILDFWASWCGPCVIGLDELESLREEHPEWTGKVEVLAVSVDERNEDAIAIFKEKGWSNFSAVWAGPEVLKAYRVAGLPTVFVLDRDGKVVAADHRLDIAAIVTSLLRGSLD